MIANALSVDVEEYDHGDLESRVEQSLDDLLELFATHAVKGTFFVLGEIAALHPGSVRKIAAEGHEVACHSDRHEDVYCQSPAEFRRDVRQAKQRIEDAIGARVVGYRAPNFSIGRAQCWAYQILLEEGFRYDSSTYPIVHDRYGHHRGPRFPFEIWRDGSERLVEFPIGTVRVFGWNLPIGGGGYFRLAPFPVTRLGIERVNAIEHRPVMFYLHPWEKQAGKLGRLLQRFHFAAARDVLKEWMPAEAVPEAAPRPHLVAARGSRIAPLTRSSPLVHVSRVAPDALRELPRVSSPQSKGHLAHSPEWASVIRQSYGHTPLYLAAEDESGRRGLLPAVVVRRPFLGPVVASMPFLDGGGPCAGSPDLEGPLLSRLMQEARRIGAKSVEVRSSHRLPIDAVPAEHKVNLVLPLTPGPDALFAGIDRAARSQIRKAERSGLSIEVGGREHLDAFFAICAMRMHELGSPVHAKTFFEAILNEFADRARVVLAMKGATPVGGLIAIASEDTITVPWASSLREYASLCPNMLLYWETIRAASRDGFQRFDFGRSTRQSGTYRFKQQWGAKDEPIYWYSIPVAGHQESSVKPAPSSAEGPPIETTGAADLGVQLWRCLPHGISRQLGPYVRKYLTQ